MLLKEKDELLKELEDYYIEKDDNININLLFSIIICSFIVIGLLFPKIFFTNNIYLTSVQIKKLKSEYLSLHNENKMLKSKIQLLLAKNAIEH